MKHSKESGVDLAHRGADDAGAPGNRGIPTQAGWSVMSVPLNPEPSHANRV